jgi:glycosyltransferase involved in cell wall biosynthesis
VREKSRLASVIIPVYNRERYVAQSIESALAQTYRPVELIVVDDGSSDRSGAIARSFEAVRYIHQPNQGVAVARNTAVAAARGEFVSFLDADDVWLPGKLEVQISYLLKHPECDLVFSHVEPFIDSEVTLPSELISQLLTEETFNMITLATRKSVFERVGWFDPSYTVGSDFEWVTRARDLGVKMWILPDVLSKRRIHDTNLSYNHEARRASVLKMMRASIGRKGQRRDEP